jgi:hypothetical protein
LSVNETLPAKVSYDSNDQPEVIDTNILTMREPLKVQNFPRSTLKVAGLEGGSAVFPDVPTPKTQDMDENDSWHASIRSMGIDEGRGSFVGQISLDNTPNDRTASGREHEGSDNFLSLNSKIPRTSKTNGGGNSDPQKRTTGASIATSQQSSVAQPIIFDVPRDQKLEFDKRQSEQLGQRASIQSQKRNSAQERPTFEIQTPPPSQIKSPDPPATQGSLPGGNWGPDYPWKRAEKQPWQKKADDFAEIAIPPRQKSIRTSLADTKNAPKTGTLKPLAPKGPVQTSQASTSISGRSLIQETLGLGSTGKSTKIVDDHFDSFWKGKMTKQL